MAAIAGHFAGRDASARQACLRGRGRSRQWKPLLRLVSTVAAEWRRCLRISERACTSSGIGDR